MKVNKIINSIIVFTIVALSQLTIAYAQLKPSLTLVHNDEYDHLKLASLAFSPDGNLMITGLMDGIIWDLNTGEQLLRINCNGIGQVAFSPDGSMVVSGHAHRLKRIWDVKTGELLYVHEEPMDLNDPLIPISISAISFTPDGDKVVYLGQYGALKEWNYVLNDIKYLNDLKHNINDIQFLNDNKNVLLNHYIVSLLSGEIVHQFSEGSSIYDKINNKIYTLKFTGSSLQYRNVVEYDANTFNKTYEFPKFTSYNNVNKISPNGNFVMVGKSKNSNEETRIINVQTTTVMKRFENSRGEMEYVDKIVFSPNGKHVALVSGNVVNLYDISDLTAGAKYAESLNP